MFTSKVAYKVTFVNTNRSLTKSSVTNRSLTKSSVTNRSLTKSSVRIRFIHHIHRSRLTTTLNFVTISYRVDNNFDLFDETIGIFIEFWNASSWLRNTIIAVMQHIWEKISFTPCSYDFAPVLQSYELRTYGQ